jgi:hypothetical protein
MLRIRPLFAIPQSALPLLILTLSMRNQPFALEALQGLDELKVELECEPDSETDEPLRASGILLAVGLCVPFWTWMFSILF